MTVPSREYHVLQIDAFTTHKFEGNAASVVLDAQGLSEDEMQRIAREMNNSETAFILPPDGDDHELNVRYFTPSVEVPFCGHATIAAHYARAILGRLGSHAVRQKSRAGPIEIDVREIDGDYHVSMLQRPPEFQAPLSDDIASATMAAVSGSVADLMSDCPVQVVSTGHSKVLVGLRSRAAVLGLTPISAALVALSREIGSNGFHFFALEAVESGVLTTCRMFAPAIGILEDPVTGNGNGPLGAYLVRHRLIDFPHDGTFSFRSAQGHAVSRPGIADVTVYIERGEPVRTRVGGAAVLVFSTTIRL